MVVWPSLKAITCLNICVSRIMIRRPIKSQPPWSQIINIEHVWCWSHVRMRPTDVPRWLMSKSRPGSVSNQSYKLGGKETTKQFSWVKLKVEKDQIFNLWQQLKCVYDRTASWRHWSSSMFVFLLKWLLNCWVVTADRKESDLVCVRLEDYAVKIT